MRAPSLFQSGAELPARLRAGGHEPDQRAAMGDPVTAALPNVVVDSLMGHEGHIASLGDDVPGKPFSNFASHLLKSRSSRGPTARRDHIVEGLLGSVRSLRAVNGGRTLRAIQRALSGRG
jgi:hypothetical protein